MLLVFFIIDQQLLFFWGVSIYWGIISADIFIAWWVFLYQAQPKASILDIYLRVSHRTKMNSFKLIYYNMPCGKYDKTILTKMLLQK